MLQLEIWLNSEDPEDLKRKRMQANKKKAQAISAKEDKKEGAPSDPLQGKDPWASYASTSKEVPAASQTTPSSVAASSTSFHDARVSSILSRLDRVEERNSNLEGKVESIAHNVEHLGTSMTTQFTDVMRALDKLATSQSESRKRAAEGDGSQPS